MATRNGANIRASRGKINPLADPLHPDTNALILSPSGCDSGNIVGTVPPGKAGIKQTNGSQDLGTLPGLTVTCSPKPPIFNGSVVSANAADNFDSTYTTPHE